MTAALEAAVRDEWGRLLALLVAQYRRLDLAEDGLADAVEAATRTWPDLPGGVPDNPAAWLLTAARRRVVDRLRPESVATRTLPLLAVEAELTEEARARWPTPGPPTSCARRAAAAGAAVRAPVAAAGGGRGADPADGAGRLDRGPGPAVPGAHQHHGRAAHPGPQVAGRRVLLGAGRCRAHSRVGVVADVAYLAFTAGYAAGSGPDLLRADVSAEAIRLVRVLRDVVPLDRAATQHELDALLALMLLQHSRRDARVDDGRLVLLPDQDRSRWHQAEIAEALALLDAARPRPARAVPPPGADRRRARRGADRGPDGLGADRDALRRAARARATPPWSGSTARSRSPRPTGRWRAWPRSPSAARPGTG